MENEKKKKSFIAPIICWIIGVCLIIVGIVLPQSLNRDEKYTFSVDDDGFGSFYEFEIEINETIDTDSAYAKIKVEGAKTETFKLEYNFGESEYGDYIFTLELFGDDAHRFNEVVEVQITTSSGKVLVLKEESVFDDFGDKASNVMLTIFPITFGVFFIVIGFVLMFIKKHGKHIKKVNEKIMDKLFGESDESQKPVEVAQQEPETITCKYCGLENDNSNVKCEHCGAPLIRKRKK